jgi:hypothetical protein
LSEDSKYFDTNGVAAYLRKTPAAIRNDVLRRRIPYRKTAGRLLFIRTEIDEWIMSAPGVSLADLRKREKK